MSDSSSGLITKMSWIQTLWGNEYDPFKPDSDIINIQEIAHSLAMQCRFNGHTKQFYSVAQHSVLVSKLLEEWGHSLHTLKQGLLHDAAETYVGDTVSPIKRNIPDIQIQYNHQAVARRFGLSYPSPDCVAQADVTMLMTERRDLMRKSFRPWFENEDDYLLPTWSIGPELQWRGAMAMFMARFQELWFRNDS